MTDLPRAHDAIALGDTAVDQLSREAYEQIVKKEPDLLRILAASTAQRLLAAGALSGDE